jgi:hypothetical protein
MTSVCNRVFLFSSTKLRISTPILTFNLFGHVKCGGAGVSKCERDLSIGLLIAVSLTSTQVCLAISLVTYSTSLCLTLDFLPR